MIQQLTIQVVFVVYSFLFASFQVPAIKAMRDYVPINNPYHNSFHSRGLLISLFIGAILSGYFSLSLRAFEMLFLLSMWYSIIFDAVIGKEVDNDFFFIGGTAKADIFIKSTLGKHAGLIKVIICTIIIIGLNTLLMRA